MKQHFLVTASLAAAVAVLAYSPAMSLSEATTAGAVRCVDTTVTTIQKPRYSQGPNGKLVLSGAGFGEVTFASYLGEENVEQHRPHATVAIGDQPGANVAAAERPGDKVRLCLLSSPAREDGCDPTRDPRGREYRVWDYHQHAAYTGTNAEHDCGGA